MTRDFSTSNSTSEFQVIPDTIQAEQAKLTGNKYYMEGDYHKAYEMYSLAISKSTETEGLATFYSNRSNTCIQLNDYVKALSDAEKCIELRPDWSKGFYRKAICLIRIGDIENAQKYFQFAYEKSTDLKEKEEIEKIFLNEKEENTSKSSRDEKKHNRKLINFLLKYADDNSDPIKPEDTEIKDQVDFLMSQYIKPYEDDAFISLAVYHGLDSGQLTFENARRWINFGVIYGAGNSIDLLNALKEYVNLTNEYEIKSKLEEIIDLCGIESAF